MFDDDLPPGFVPLGQEGIAPPPLPAPAAPSVFKALRPLVPQSDDLPEGFEVEKMGSTLPAPPKPKAPNVRPHPNAFEAARSIFPDLEITDWSRDANSALGRANPDSWHVKSKGAIDARPRKDMTFDQYVQRYRDAGYPILEAKDEVANPAKHATGPHWHVVLGDRPEPKLPMGTASLAVSALQGSGALDNRAAPPAAPQSAPVVEEQGIVPRIVDGASEILFRDQQPTQSTWNWSDADRAKLQSYVGKAKSAEELDAYARQLSGGVAGIANAAEVLAHFKKTGQVGGVTDVPLPEVTNRDGTTGAAMRGVADPFNVLDELGAVADTVVGGEGRESIWNSNRGFGDILYGNIDRNRAILRADERDHWKARFLGQLGSGLAMPIGASAKTVGQLAKFGAVEGGLAGFGAGEGGVVDRLPNSLMGAGLGAAGGAAIGKVFQLGNKFYVRVKGGGIEEVPESALRGAYDAAPVANDGLQGAGPTPAARTQPAGGALGGGDPSLARLQEGLEQIEAMRAVPRTQAMESGLDIPMLKGPEERLRDYINVRDELRSAGSDDLPPGFKEVDEDLGQLTPRQPFRPEDVVPIPGNRVESAEELAQIGDPRPLLDAPNERLELQVRKVRNATTGNLVNYRGPLDAEAYLRSLGGLKDDAGELRHIGITNNRARPENGQEARIGRILDPDNGLTLDEAGEALAEAGYFRERPTTADVVEMLRESRLGRPLYHDNDLDEVARFSGAQEQRYQVEAARQSGTPLAEDIGEPIAQDDLAKLTPPDSAYEDAPRMVGKVGNLNLERVDNPEEVSRLVQHIRNTVPEIDEARGATVTNEELKNLARDLNVTPERILSWNKGSLPSPAEVFASRVIVHQGRQKIKDLARRARGASDEELAKFHNVVMKQAALERQLAGMAADAGRLLQQFNAVASAGDLSDQAIKAYLRGAGGRENVEDIADKLVDLVENPQAAGEFISKLPKATTMEKLNEFWINSLLSGIPTHLVNFGGNGLMALLTLPEEAIIAGVGKLTRSADRAHLREVGVRAWGMMQGAREGLRAARIAFKTGEPLDAVSKVEATNYRAIPGKLGEFIRTPTKALSASDEFWSAMHLRGATNAGAMRRALNEPGTYAEKMERFKELRDNPDDELKAYARAEALYRTFRKPLGKGGRAVQTLSNEFPGAKVILPFVRTPINILKYAGERSVLAPVALKPFLREINAGGVKRDAVLGKFAMGAGLSAFAAEAALGGRISGGGPTDPKEAAALRNSGWQPYSVKIGDSWVSYQRFEPLSLIIGATADFVELGKWATTAEGDDIALGIATAIAKNITSKTWTSGLADFFEVLSDPDRYGKRWISRMAGSMVVPAFVGNAARAADPDMREVNNALDAIKNRIPFLSHDLSVRRDVWGDPIKRGNLAGEGVLGGLYNYVSPITFNTQSADPVKREVGRLKAPLTMPQRSIKVAGVNTQLTPEQYGYYVQLSGQPAKSYLADFIKSPDWQAMTDDERRDHLRETMSDFRASARDELKAMFPELAAEKDDLPPGFEPLPEGFQVAQ